MDLATQPRLELIQVADVVAREKGIEREEVLEAMRSEGKNIMQQESYVVGDAIFCVYNSDSEDLIKEHSERSGVPASEISEIATVIKHNTSVVS